MRFDDEARRINLSWLLRLRWGAAACQIVTILFVDRVMRMALPLLPLLGIVLLTVVSNAACALWMRKRKPVHEWMLALTMAVDILLLTGMLYFTGGPFNPFSFLYVVHIALGAVVLRAYFTWCLFALSFACFGALFLEHVWLKLEWFGSPLSHADHMRMHLHGMWLAFGVAAGFIVYFVNRVTSDLAKRESELIVARAIAHRTERLASLATLSAGAAHELSTPLSTIAVVAKELERQLASGIASDDAVADARLIRTEVERCRGIIAQMAADAGQSSGEAFADVTIRSLVAATLENLPEQGRIRVVLDEPTAAAPLRVPMRAVAHALRGVVKNALEASASAHVVIEVKRDGECYRIRVKDSGPGISSALLPRVGEPFFTTKQPGQGMGLGLFLTRTVLERLGGSLVIESQEKRGTTVELNVPSADYGTDAGQALHAVLQRT